MTKTDPLDGPRSTRFRDLGTQLCVVAGLDPKTTIEDINRVDETHVELYPAILDGDGNMQVEGDSIKTRTVVVELPEGHPWMLEYSPLDHANAAIAAAAGLLEQVRVDVIMNQSSAVWTSTERLAFVDRVLDALNGRAAS